jgi:hypothetical protein
VVQPNKELCSLTREGSPPVPSLWIFWIYAGGGRGKGLTRPPTGVDEYSLGYNIHSARRGAASQSASFPQALLNLSFIIQ